MEQTKETEQQNNIELPMLTLTRVKSIGDSEFTKEKVEIIARANNLKECKKGISFLLKKLKYK